MKIHMLGRNSFRKVVEKRDYLGHRHLTNWLYISRLSAAREFEFMKALHEKGFPVPKPISWNRHCVIMTHIDGYILYYISNKSDKIKELDNLEEQYNHLRSVLIRMAEVGLVHCDFNEFNLILNEESVIQMIDFPQMVSIDHPEASFFFNRDLECIKRFFERRFNFKVDDDLQLCNIERTDYLDHQLKASGYKNKVETKNIESDKSHSDKEFEDDILIEYYTNKINTIKLDQDVK